MCAVAWFLWVGPTYHLIIYQQNSTSTPARCLGRSPDHSIHPDSRSPVPSRSRVGQHLPFHRPNLILEGLNFPEIIFHLHKIQNFDEHTLNVVNLERDTQLAINFQLQGRECLGIRTRRMINDHCSPLG